MKLNQFQLIIIIITRFITRLSYYTYNCKRTDVSQRTAPSEGACWVFFCSRHCGILAAASGSFKSEHDFLCMRTQTRPRFILSSERVGLSEKFIHSSVHSGGANPLTSRPRALETGTISNRPPMPPIFHKYIKVGLS